MPSTSVDSLTRSPWVDAVEPDALTIATQAIRGRTGPSGLMSQVTPWGVDSVGAPLAWSFSTGGSASLLIVDQGHFRGHEDLPVVPTQNCFGQFNGCDDAHPNSHGTHVTGIATARDNGVGVVGLAPGAGGGTTFVWGACEDNGACDRDEIIAAINWAAGNLSPRGVINLSLGSGDYSWFMSTAVAAASSAGVVVVAAAGNNGANQTFYPAAFTNVIGVAGMREDKTFPDGDNAPCSNTGDAAPGSNWGAHVDFVAPWDAVGTIAMDQYAGHEEGWCGTSMATPHVAKVGGPSALA